MHADDWVSNGSNSMKGSSSWSSKKVMVVGVWRCEERMPAEALEQRVVSVLIDSL